MKSEKRHPVVLITLPKSGSMYFLRTLTRAYSLPPYQRFGGIFPNLLLDRRAMREMAEHGGITLNHVPPSDYNISVLNYYFDRIALHVRDPRQALLSWVHHVRDRVRTDRLDCMLFGLPADYFDRSPGEQIDFQIDTFLPKLVRWLEEWSQCLDAARLSGNVLLTRFEDFRTDSQQAVAKIAAFFGFEWPPPGALPVFDNEAIHFRSGLADEWRTVFTPDQVSRANRIVPPSILARFCWTA